MKRDRYLQIFFLLTWTSSLFWSVASAAHTFPPGNTISETNLPDAYELSAPGDWGRGMLGDSGSQFFRKCCPSLPIAPIFGSQHWGGRIPLWPPDEEMVWIGTPTAWSLADLQAAWLASPGHPVPVGPVAPVSTSSLARLSRSRAAPSAQFFITFAHAGSTAWASSWRAAWKGAA